MSKQSFDALIEESGTIYHGYTENLVPLYQQCDIFVLPSTYGEGLPRVLLEAAASGCLLLAYDNAGSNRAINHGVNGWTTKEPSVQALCEAIEHYLTLPLETRQQMSQASRQHVENGFNETDVIDAYLSIIDKVD